MEEIVSVHQPLNFKYVHCIHVLSIDDTIQSMIGNSFVISLKTCLLETYHLVIKEGLFSVSSERHNMEFKAAAIDIRGYCVVSVFVKDAPDDVFDWAYGACIFPLVLFLKGHTTWVCRTRISDVLKGKLKEQFGEGNAVCIEEEDTSDVGEIVNDIPICVL